MGAEYTERCKKRTHYVFHKYRSYVSVFDVSVTQGNFEPLLRLFSKRQSLQRTWYVEMSHRCSSTDVVSFQSNLVVYTCVNMLSIEFTR